MAYTQEQLNGMTVDQLVAIIMQKQTQKQTAIPEQPVTTTDQVAVAETTDPVKGLQSDIDKIEAKIASLKEDGEKLYADAIAALEAKRDALVAEAKTEISEEETEVKNFVDQFRDKYLPWVEGVAVLIVLLKVFGII